MSRILKVMIALLAIAAIAAPAFAEDRLSLSGEMRVRGFFLNQDNGTTDESSAWNDMRLRMMGKLAVAEGVSVIFRTDMGEAKMGANDRYSNRGDSAFAGKTAGDQEMHFDVAMLSITKNGYTLNAGQQYYRLGTTGMISDHVGAGFTLKKGPVTLFHVKVQEDAITESDESVTGANFAFGNDDFSGNVFAAYDVGQASDDNLLGVGVSLNANLGAVAIKGELDYLSGENAAGADEKGLNLYVDASAAISETVTVGGILLYGQAQDGTDEQVVGMNRAFGDWRPLSYGYETVEFTQEINPFDISDGGDAGMQAVSIYADFKASDALGLKFAAAYAQPDDEDQTTIDDATTLNASLKYAVMANTSFTTHVNYQMISDTADKDNLQVISGLKVKF